MVISFNYMIIYSYYLLNWFRASDWTGWKVNAKFIPRISILLNKHFSTGFIASGFTGLKGHDICFPLWLIIHEQPNIISIKADTWKLARSLWREGTWFYSNYGASQNATIDFGIYIFGKIRHHQNQYA